MSIGREGSSLSDSLCHEQRLRWMAGERVLVEEYVERHPELRSDPEALFEIIASEFHLREEFGEFPDVSEYALRFPELGDRLSRLASTGRAASDVHNVETRAEIPQAPAGLHCRFCGRVSHPAKISEAGELRCQHCQKVLMVVEETTPYMLTSVAVIGRFELREHLGRGQFGDVWRAYDVDLRREVAVKIPRRMPENKAMHSLFVREARAAARLRHPNIVPVYEIGKVDERIYIVSEFIKGATLKKWLEQRKFTPREAAQLCATLARALHYAHQEGIVHRDLKPGNILMDANGEPHIADFGLAKQSSVDATLTVEGQILGTPAYMSPEQARGEAHKADRRCDVYSLGVILYELLSGRRPFESRDEVLIYEILNIEPPSPRKKNREIPRDLETICLKAMAKNPMARYSNSEDLAEDLRRFLQGEPILARRQSLPSRVWRWTRRNRSLAASLVALFSGAMLMAAIPDNPERPRVETRPVLIDTEPAGATLTLFPLDEATGEPRLSERIVSKERTPARLDLPASDYLVVAVLEEHGFHEVLRHVPSKDERIPFDYNHRAWRALADGTIHLPQIKIPSDKLITQNMALIEGSTDFLSGEAGFELNPPTRRHVPSFYMDCREFTVGDRKRAVNGNLPFHLRDNPPPDDFALTGEDWNGAVRTAELAGKRLMTDIEYEFAATARGTKRFPSGNNLAVVAADASSFVAGGLQSDRLDMDPPVYGLVSGVAEWTHSRLLPLGRDSKRTRMICGGAWSTILGNLVVDGAVRDPRKRQVAAYYSRHPGLGFRCVRSAKPRLTPEDFSRVRDNSPDVPQ